MTDHHLEEHPDEGYAGPAELALATQGTDDSAEPASPLTVRVTLRGLFQPIDGRYHWYGRLAADDRVDALGGAGTSVVLTTPHGRAEGRLSDVDPWGRYRVDGVGRPPFRVEV